jgi:hypothetical protein
VSDSFELKPADDRPLEEIIGIQAFEVDLRVAVMTCLCEMSATPNPALILGRHCLDVLLGLYPGV